MLSYVYPIAFSLAALAGAPYANAQDTTAQDPPDVLGTLALDAFYASADSAWAVPGARDYVPNAEVTAELADAIEEVTGVTIYYGSWCGDSRREVPAALKTFEAAGYPADRISLVGVSSDFDAYKQSPDGATDGQYVYRVPTIVLHDGSGGERGRIVELPKLSIERDLLAIASGAAYAPSYPGLALAAELDAEGLLGDPNVLGLYLAQAFGPAVEQPSELNSVGYVLLGQGRTAAAVKVLYANTQLFPDVANGYDSLAEALAADGQIGLAVEMQRRAVKLDPGNDLVMGNLEKLLAQVE